MASILSGKNDGSAADWEDLHAALVLAESADSDRFVIVERSDQYFMQTLCVHDGWILEKREGDADHHFRAVSPRAEGAGMAPDELLAKLFRAKGQGRSLLDRDEVYSALHMYLMREAEPEWLIWERYNP